VIRISKLTNKFFIHSIDISENEKANLLKSIKQYERLIMEVSR
jgi:multicomponent Na+:H+ antiporter subunit E